jgi:hypothetical protein
MAKSRKTKAENATASHKGKETADKNPVKQTVKKTSKVMVRFTKSPAGMYFLPWNVGQEIFVDRNQSEQMEATGHCEILE